MKIGFIGCGNMGSAMISGILKKGIFQKDEIIVSNLTEEGSKRSREKLGVVTTLDNRQVVKNAKTIVLAVKPQFYQEVIEEVRADLTPEHMVIGIAPGKSLDWIQEICQTSLKVARLMPNTPAQVGEGMTGVCRNELVTDDDLEQVLKITDSFGKTQVVSERLMDAVGVLRHTYLYSLKQWQMQQWHRGCQENRHTSLLHSLFWEVPGWYLRQECILEN